MVMDGMQEVCAFYDEQPKYDFYFEESYKSALAVVAYSS